jgi:molybdopterin-synthase adenylyltransferase
VLRACHVIIGCVDSYRERDELERFARRFLIAYIDIGMDVHPLDNGLVVGGQVVLSLPGHL